MLSRFLPRFLMTFCICLFIVMMQFLWRYIDELVGKGLSIDVVAELFFYAALSMVPLALPLSILLAALMTFGDLGEHVELTALKSSGISLTTIMKPLAILMAIVAVGAFFFQNNVLPKSQVKMWTLLFSMRQTSPTLDIPEGTVYSQIPGYNIYVKRKDKERDMLYNVLIYDVSHASMFPRIVAADSGRLSMTEDKRSLFLKLYKGAWYEQMSSGGGVNGMSGDLYRRETFHDKEILIPYDANFSRMDDETMRSQYVGKDIAELRQTIDSVRLKVDSAAMLVVNKLRSQPLCGVPTQRTLYKDGKPTVIPVNEVKLDKPVDVNKAIKELPSHDQEQIINQALMRTMSAIQDLQFQGYTISDDNFITVLQHLAERRCHEVDALGGATSENHLLDAAGIDEATHLFTRLLHEICRFLREGVDATVHIGLVVVVHPVDSLHNGTRRLGRRSIVEIDERAALNLALQDGIILTYLVDVHISLFPVICS